MTSELLREIGAGRSYRDGVSQSGTRTRGWTAASLLGGRGSLDGWSPLCGSSRSARNGRSTGSDAATTDTYVGNDGEFDTSIRPLITPYLRRSRAVLQYLEPDGERSTASFFHRVGLAVPTRSRTLLDLYPIADDLADLIAAASAVVGPRPTTSGLAHGHQISSARPDDPPSSTQRGLVVGTIIGGLLGLWGRR